MQITASAALWFLPFVVPICLYTVYTDMAEMRIKNHAVVALFGVFAVVGLIALPLDVYLWRYLSLVVVLLAGILLNMGGALGAGDAKFAAAAAPFIPLGDLRLVMVLFAATLLAAYVAHRIAKHTGLRHIAPGWKSWQSGSKFPMGMALGGTLAIYLLLGVFQGA
ncbi:prepilin peptidase [Thalassococcus sp. BH17M4-6]|uniref:prepilin peptidase n=1 Tax=Thalassococcus sp. BH17M4-6 TaxID=3413148 RepID=UPI003BE1AC69